MAEHALTPMDRYTRHWRFGDIAWLSTGELLFVANITGQFNLWHQTVGPKGERGFAQPLTAYADHTVRTIAPTPDGRSVIFTADQDGDEHLQIYRIDGRGGEPTTLTDDRKVFHGFSAGGLDPSRRRLLYCDNGRNPADLDIVLLDLSRHTTVRPLPEGGLWSDASWDPSGRRFYALKALGNTQIQTFIHDVSRGTTTEVVPHDTDAWAVAEAWTRDGRSLLVRTDIDREFKQLELVEVASGKRKVLASPKGDVESVQYSPKSSTLLYSVNVDGFSELYAGRLGARPRRISSLRRGSLASLVWGSPLAMSPDGKTAAAVWDTGTRPAEIMVFSLEGRWVTQLSESTVGDVPNGPLPGPKLIRFASFDGRQISAYYYLPKRRPKGKMPAVLSIHGGPESQERPEWRYHGLYAWLNAQGIAVLAPNIRGSTGYGKSFQKLIHHDWGGGELQDLKAAAEWMRARPELDGSRFGVFGGSFGGFATLSCVTRLPEYWKVGVDVFGPSNLITFLKSVPPFWSHITRKWVGDPETEPDFLRERSPITYIDNVRADLLVIQGANDFRVNKAESDQMVELLRAKGRKVEYLVFDDEGHGFTRIPNAIRAWETSGRFLADHLLR